MPLLDLFWSMAVFFLWVAWIWLLIGVFADIFRSDDLSGWGKAGWIFFTLALPLLGVLAYMIARGSKMQEREERRRAQAERDFREYVQNVTSTPPISTPPTATDELTRLAGLRDSGVLTEEEFQTQKSRLLTA